MFLKDHPGCFIDNALEKDGLGAGTCQAPDTALQVGGGGDHVKEQ